MIRGCPRHHAAMATECPAHSGAQSLDTDTWSIDHLQSGAICVHIVCASIQALPLPAALMRALPTLFPTTSAAKKACRRGGGPFSVELPGGHGRCVTTVSAGDSFTVMRNEVQRPLLELPFLDAHLAVVHKPAGLVLHGAGDDNLSARLLEQLGGEVDPCHRLDAPTEGLVVCGRTKAATANLGAQFQRHYVRKRYVAVVHGRLPANAGQVDSQIEGHEARTQYCVRW